MQSIRKVASSRISARCFQSVAAKSRAAHTRYAFACRPHTFIWLNLELPNEPSPISAHPSPASRRSHPAFLSTGAPYLIFQPKPLPLNPIYISAAKDLDASPTRAACALSNYQTTPVPFSDTCRPPRPFARKHVPPRPQTVILLQSKTNSRLDSIPSRTIG